MTQRKSHRPTVPPPREDDNAPPQTSGMITSLFVILLAIIVVIGVALGIGLAPAFRPSQEFHMDKAMHILGFACLAIGALWILPRWIALTLTASLGPILELVQAGVPGRLADPWDALASMAGVGLGYGLTVLYRRRKQRRSTL